MHMRMLPAILDDVTHAHTHTSISTHDMVTQITFTHSKCTNVIFSLTSIIGLVSGLVAEMEDQLVVRTLYIEESCPLVR